MPNAIDPRRLEVSQPGAVRCAFRNRLGLEPGDLVGLFAGHNFALKGLKPLLAGSRRRGASGTAAAGRSTCWSAAAAIPARIGRLASRLGLGDTVHFLGFYPDVEDCYWSSDFFVQPTYYDPCSLVVLEALACGLPVITTAQNGASELMDRRPRRLHPDRARRAGRADRRSGPHDRRRGPASDVGQGARAGPPADVRRARRAAARDLRGGRRRQARGALPHSARSEARKTHAALRSSRGDRGAR